MAKFTDHHTRLKSVYFLSKKNEAIYIRLNQLHPRRGDSFWASTSTSSVGSWRRVHRTGISRVLPTDRNQAGICDNDHNVPKYLWQEAFRMAVYVTNRVPSTPLGGKTLSRCGTVEHPRNLSTFELLVPELSCMKRDTSRS